MAISDDLNSIRTHLEDDYTALETLGVSVEDRNIENIKDMANQIYAKFPKTSYAEGSNITLSNTLKGKLDFEDGIVGYGQTEQKSYEGYQLLNYTLATLKAINTTGTWNNNIYTFNGVTYTVEVENGYIKEIKTTGTATSNSILALISTMDIGAGTYYLSGCPNGGSYSTYFIYSGPGLAHNVSETPTTITFNEDTSLSSNNMRITILSGTSLSNLIWKPMLSKTNTTDFEPFVGNSPSPNPSYPQDIEVVRGNIEVVERGINWFKFDYLSTTSATANGITFSADNENETFSLTGTAQGSAINAYLFGGYTSTTPIIKLPKGEYTLYADIPTTIYSYDGTIRNAYSFTPNGTLIDIPEDFHGFTAIKPTNVVQGQTYNITGRIMILKGNWVNNIPDYQSYQTPQTYQLSLGEYEFAKIGNYVDTIEYDVDEDKVYKNEAIGKVVLNGNESWAKVGNAFQTVGVVFPSDVALRDDSKFAYSTHYIYAYYSSGISGSIKEGEISWSGTKVMTIGNTTQTLEEFKTWLSTNKPIVLYPLVEVVKQEITGTLKDQIKALYYSHSFTGTTIIEINGQLPLIIKVRALKGE